MLGAALVIGGWGDLGSPGSNWVGSVDIQELGLVDLWKNFHEIKKYFLLGKKAMTKLDSVLKSRDIILPTKVWIVKAMVFPVVMYGCESWTIKKAEC